MAKKGEVRTFNIKIRGTQITIESEHRMWDSIELLVSSLFKHYRDNRPPGELESFMEKINYAYALSKDPHYFSKMAREVGES